MERIYLDYAASTPVDPEVEKYMSVYLDEKFGNPGSLHSFGREGMAGIDGAREVLAKALGAKFHEIIFTASATEANNLAIRGVVKKLNRDGGKFIEPPYRIITTPIEHESVQETAADLKKDGIDVVYLPVSREGLIDIKDLKEALTPNTVLVSVIYASNIIGTIQPISEIAEVVKEYRKDIGKPYPLFHTDAVQAMQFLNVWADELGADMMTVSGQKVYGPKGAGGLYINEEAFSLVSPLITGGDQEFGLRAATENVPAIVGFGKAVELIYRDKDEETRRLKDLRDRLWKGLKKARPELEINGPELGDLRLPNNLNVYFPHHDMQELVVKFDMAGVSVSAGSACSMRSTKASYVIKALGFGVGRASQSLRFSVGRPTTSDQVDSAVSRIIKLL